MTSTVENLPTPSPIATHTVEEAELVLVSDNLELHITIPPGWQAQTTEEGVLLAEHLGSFVEGGKIYGVQVHVFIYMLNEINLSGHSSPNIAWTVLDKIINMPSYIGGASVTQPIGLTISGHSAAYYLLNSGDDNFTMLLAIAVPNTDSLVICNVSAPSHKVNTIRPTVTTILERIAVNGAFLDLSALADLPDPLVFPDYPKQRLPNEHSS